MDEPYRMLSPEMYEDLKETVIGILKAQGTAARKTASGNDDAASAKRMERIEKNVDTATELVTALTNRMNRVDFQPVIRVAPPDMSEVKKAFCRIGSQYERLDNGQARIEHKLGDLEARIVRAGTEIDTTEFERLSRNTVHEMQRQIHYLKQPPIVLKVIVGFFLTSLVLTWIAGHYVREARQWKRNCAYWERLYEEAKNGTKNTKSSR